MGNPQDLEGEAENPRKKRTTGKSQTFQITLLKSLQLQTSKPFKYTFKRQLPSSPVKALKKKKKRL